MKYIVCILLCVAVPQSLYAGPKQQIREPSHIPIHPTPEERAALYQLIEFWFWCGEQKMHRFRLP